MDYALDLLIPILGGLFLGQWLDKTLAHVWQGQFGLMGLWTPLCAILGFAAGLAILYRRYQKKSK